MASFLVLGTTLLQWAAFSLDPPNLRLGELIKVSETSLQRR
jgi:hypothetical protein